jgi:hypothetical protein
MFLIDHRNRAACGRNSGDAIFRPATRPASIDAISR